MATPFSRLRTIHLKLVPVLGLEYQMIGRIAYIFSTSSHARIPSALKLSTSTALNIVLFSLWLCLPRSIGPVSFQATMFHSVIARLCLLLLFFQVSISTNIEYFDTPLSEHSHIFQKCRFLRPGDCCVPVDLVLPNTRRENFRPYKIVFEYFSRSAIYVFADLGKTSACGGPSVNSYKDPSAQLNVKEFVARANQKFSGAMFTQDDRPIPVDRIRYPWSITFEDTMYYQSATDPLFYADLRGRRWIHAVPQFGKSLARCRDSVVAVLTW